MSRQAFKTEAEFQQALRRNKSLAERNQDKLIQTAKAHAVPVAGVIQSGRVLRLELLLPIKLVSEANQREHWSKRAERNAEQQAKVWEQWRELLRGVKIVPPCIIRITRIGVNKLDSDNLAGASKFLRDGIARILGCDDGSELLTWEYDQIPNQRECGVKVEFICI